MGAANTPRAHDDDCTTTGSFDDHGIDDGHELITRTYYRLTEDHDEQFEPTEEFFEQVEVAFIRTYLDLVPGEPLPKHVSAALDDAKALTRAEFVDEPDADLRTEVLPRFYQQLAAFHCKYR